MSCHFIVGLLALAFSASPVFAGRFRASGYPRHSTANSHRAAKAAKKERPGWAKSAGPQVFGCNFTDQKGWKRMQDLDAINNLNGAVATFCNSQYADLMDAYLAEGYDSQYSEFFRSDGWADEAFVNYFADKGDAKGQKFMKETELLIESVHRFSTRPIIAVNFGTVPAPASWSQYRRLIVLQAKPMPPGKCFNYNKFRAMLVSKVRTGIQQDSDQFVARGIDRMFTRTEQEVTEEYPYPILPVHWLSKDDA